MAKNISLTVLLLAVVAALMSVFVVDERQHAIKFQFGEILESEYEPGLHFMIPFINNVQKFDDRVLTLDQSPEPFLTVEKKNVIVDFFVKWRIRDPKLYYQSTNGDERIAAGRLLDIAKGGIRSEFARRTVRQVVSADRADLMDDLITEADGLAKTLGIEVIDVRVKQIELPPDVSDSVYQRMQQERQRIANQLRAEGSEKAEEIRAQADRERVEIAARAYREAQEIRGDGDAKSAEIYAGAYEQNPEFYAFYRSLEAYRKSIGGGNDIMVLEPDSEFFDYLTEQAPQN
ncbi:MAG: protease modulator HflC [Pseudomonadota bacterium]